MDTPDVCCDANVSRPPLPRPDGSWNRMPVICRGAKRVSYQSIAHATRGRISAKTAHHDHERVPAEQSAIHVRHHADRERAILTRPRPRPRDEPTRKAGVKRGEADVPDGGADVVLPTELRPGEVVRDPTDARDDDEHEQLFSIPRRLVPQAQEQREHRHREERYQKPNQTGNLSLLSRKKKRRKGKQKYALHQSEGVL